MSKSTRKNPHAHKVATGKNRTPVLMDILQHELPDAELIPKWKFASGGPIRCYRLGEVAKHEVIALREKMGKKASKSLITAAALARKALAEKEARKAAKKAKKKTGTKAKRAAKKRKQKTSDRLERALAKKQTRKPKTVEVAKKAAKAAAPKAPKAVKAPKAAAAPKAPKPTIEVQVGMTFKDNDPRRQGRTLTVVALEGDKATVESNGKKLTVALARLAKPGSATKGYSPVAA